ncbi:MAG TPA: carboxypeptidase-like regulatory domain-containing protein [Bacillota bacterium]|nr:carboxypeptidase-like regulatory domain-containing protein [Bacillota bacterium]
MKRIVNQLLWSGLSLWAATTGLHAQTPTLTISPARITNDYNGPITLSISNLLPGSKVWVAKYPDFNGNGTADPAEPMMQGWGVADGSQSLIGGVRNRNVPGDEDGSTNGQIQLVLNYPGDNPVLERIAGQYLFQVSDPQGTFTPVSAAFTIVQQAWPQAVSGTARDAGSGALLTNAMVVMVVVDGNGGSGTFTDANGNYSLSNAPGNYALLAIRPGWVADQGAAMISLGNNSHVSTNLSASAGTLYVAGRVADQSSGKPLPGLFVECENTNSLFALAFTDTNGNYSIALSPSQWKVKIKSESGLTSKGYVQTGNDQRVTLDSASLSNLNFSFPKATALIYGRVLDQNSNGLTNLVIEGQDSTYSQNSFGQSRANGNYCLGVLAGTWTAQPDNDSLAAQNLLGLPSGQVNLSAGQATNIDIHVVRATSYLRGQVLDSQNNPVGLIGLVLNQVTTNGSNSQNLNSQTAPDGTFEFGVYAGQWNLALECNQAAQRGLVSPVLRLNVLDGINQTNLTLRAQQTTANLTVVVTDTQGHPVLANAWASYSPDGGYNSGCGSQSGSTAQLSVFNGTWVVGLSGDVTGQGYDNPGQQTVTVNGTNLTVNFMLYPLGQTPARLSVIGQYGQLQLFLSGASGAQYRIETSTNLSQPGSWVPLSTNTMMGGSLWYGEPIPANGPSRFYRTVRLQ